MTTTRIHLGPDDSSSLADAITAAGGTLSSLDDADAVVWASGPDTFPAELPDTVRWVQLPSAGVERWIAAGLVDDTRQWTSAAGAYSATCAEHAFALLLAGVRHISAQAGATSWDRDRFGAHTGSLAGTTVAIVGCGGIGRALIPYLTASGSRTVAVTRSGRAVPGAAETVTADRLHELWGRVDHVVVAAPSTADTEHLIDAAVLDALPSTAWIVNIARGSLIDTDAVVDALTSDSIGGVGLDVTEPEPLPDGHPLWGFDNAIITPHIANPNQVHAAALAAHIRGNVERFCAGEELAAIIDLERGY